MSSRGIEQLPQVSHKDVKPLYSYDEIADKLATAVSYARQGGTSKEQSLELELMYSIVIAMKVHTTL
jgi:hypothetical protein